MIPLPYSPLEDIKDTIATSVQDAAIEEVFELESGNSRRVRYHPTTRAKQAAFLKAFESVGAIRHAAKIARIDPKRHYEWKEEDPAYEEKFLRAKKLATDTLHAEAVRRAVVGVLEPVGWFRGSPGGYVRRYSDPLLIFLLKAADPSTYNDRMRLDVSTDKGQALAEKVFDSLSLDIRKRILEEIEAGSNEIIDVTPAPDRQVT